MIFDNIMKQYSLHEADNTGDDNTNQPQQQNQNTGDNADDNQDTTTDTGEDDEYSVNDPNAEGNDNTTDDQNQDDNQEDTEDEYSVTDPDEEGEDDTQPDENEGGEGEDDEYSVNDPDEEGNDDTTDDTSTDENDPSAKLKDLEKSIFDQLPPEMQKAKVSELKKLYTNTYEKCQSIIDIISTAEKQPNQVKVYDYILNSLLDLQKYIKDYLTNVFDSKTYIENMTELQKYLAILDTVNGVFEDMTKPSTEDNNK